MLFAPRRWLAAIILAAVLVAPLYRDLAVDVLKEDGWGTLPFGCLDTLGVGALLAIAFRDARSPQAVYAALGRLVLPIGLLLFLALHWIALRTGNLRPLVASHEIAYAMVCCWLIAGAYRGFGGLAGRLLELRPVVYLGRISYGIYAYHMLMPWFLARIFGKLGWEFPAPGPARLVIASAVTVAVAMASWRFFERPLNDLKRFVPYQRRNHASASAAAS